jgi:hypothetical protein
MQTNPTGERLPSPHPIKACWVSFDERRWVSFDERQGQRLDTAPVGQVVARDEPDARA